jgi:uncharacterized protein (TIGR03000 family)
MLRRFFALGGTVAVAALLMSPDLSQAQHGGGGHGGGGHGGGGGGHGGGGFHGGGGGFRNGGFRGEGFRGDRFGGWGWGGAWPYWYGGWGYPGYAYSDYDWGYPNYGYNNWYPDYYGSGYTGYYSGYGQTYDGYSYAPAYASDYGTAGYSSAGNEDVNAAYISVQVPPNAQVMFEGEKTSQTGSVRRYISPPLTQGREYTYDIQARWNENGREVNLTRHVTVRPGQQVSVDFLTGGPNLENRRG